MGEKRKNRQVTVLGVCVLLFLFLFALCNIKLSIDPSKAVLTRESTFSEYVDEIQTAYTSNDLMYKNGFVNLNGWFAKVTGRRVYNDVVLTNNGMLTHVESQRSQTHTAEGITYFSDYLSEYTETSFLYVQLPYKEDFADEMIPEGVSSYANENADALLAALAQNGVNTLDLRPFLSQTPEMVEEYFFHTDHHWNSDGAFVGFEKITQWLAEAFPARGVDLSYTQNDQWERHTLEDWFLGSWGKRVGEFFGGVDDLTWYTPKFETDMSCMVPKHRAMYKGDFSAVNLRNQYIESKDYFGYNAYCLHIGGDYPLVQHRNLNAPSDVKVLFIKDSFSLPLQSYLSTVFQEIDVIDPRYFTECSIAEYVNRTNPDVVILGINPNVLGNYECYYDFGVDQAIGTVNLEPVDVVLENNAIVMEAKDNKYHYIRINLENGETYRFSFDDVTFQSGESDGVSVLLYNTTTKEQLVSSIFDLEYCRNTGGGEWYFSTPESSADTHQLLLYAGIAGATQGIGVTYHNVEIVKLGP